LRIGAGLNAAVKGNVVQVPQSDWRDVQAHIIRDIVADVHDDAVAVELLWLAHVPPEVDQVPRHGFELRSDVSAHGA
jgi:hypothetical protein